MSGEGDSEATGGASESAVDPARERADKLVGTVVAERYRIHNVLAMGGMGAVYTGEHVHMRKRVAIKVLHPDTEGLPGLVARFEREAIVGAHVEHKNIAAARDFGRMADGSYYLVLEFVRGLTLRQLMRQGPIPLRRAVGIARQIATGLAKIHAKGIVHRDLNPRNVMVIPGTKDLVKLIDFGFAKVPVEKFSALSVQRGTPMAPSQITGDGVIFGTIGFLAPEAALGMKFVDKRSDLYALGAILYEMLSGEPPFEAPTQASHYLKHRIEAVPPMKARAPNVEVPAAVEAIAMKLLAKEPGDRYQRADEVGHALEEVLAAAPEAEASAEHDAPHSAELTVAGADDAGSLPRYEDVAVKRSAIDVPPARKSESSGQRDIEAETTSTQLKPSARSAAPAEAPKRSSSWVFAVIAALALGGAGVLAYQRFGPGAAPSAKASAAPVTVAASVAPSSTALAASASPASAAPVASASAAPRPTEIDGMGADAWRGIVRQASSSRDYAHAIKGIYALATLDPNALAGTEIKSETVEVVVNAGPVDSSKLVRTLAEGFGTDGIDVLYDIVVMRGGSDAASIADELLHKPEVLARGSVGLRIALELRRAPCEQKAALLDRAVSEGDQRTLTQLGALRDPACDVATGACCLSQNPAVDKAARDLTNRIVRH